jgi:tetratricopeptide (TPR) repeat protein
MVLMAGILRWIKLDWWMASGRVDRKRGRYQAALQSFQQLVALYPQHLLAQSYVGAWYMSLRQYDDAVLAFERGLQRIRRMVAIRNSGRDSGSNIGRTRAQNMVCDS